MSYINVSAGEEHVRVNPFQNYKSLVNWNVGILGGSGSGKTITIKQILSILSDEFSEIYVFSESSDTSAKASFAGIAPDLAIFPKVTPETLEKIFERQMIKTAIYNDTRNKEKLTPIFNKIRGMRQMSHISNMSNVKNSIRDKILREKDEVKKNIKLKELEEKYEEKLIMYMRSEIIANIRSIRPDDKQQETLLKHMRDFNPKICVVYDDVTEQIGSILKSAKTDIGMRMLFKSRHFNITNLFAIHDPKFITPPLRSSLHYKIFCEKSMIDRYITLAKPSKQTALLMNNIGNIIFNGSSVPEYSKVLINQKEEYMYIPPQVVNNKRVGKKEFWDICEKAVISAESRILSNPMAQGFFS